MRDQNGCFALFHVMRQLSQFYIRKCLLILLPLSLLQSYNMKVSFVSSLSIRRTSGIVNTSHPKSSTVKTASRSRQYSSNQIMHCCFVTSGNVIDEHGNNIYYHSSVSPKSSFLSQPSYHKFNYLHEATKRYIVTPHGSLIKGKHHELTSLLKGWLNLIDEVGIITLSQYYSYSEGKINIQGQRSSSNSVEIMPVLLMESILKRIIDEFEIGNNTSVHITTELYNLVIQAWCAVASTPPSSMKQSQINDFIKLQMDALHRASVILSQLQQTYEQSQNKSIQPNTTSFQCIIKAYTTLAVSISTKLVNVSSSASSSTTTFTDEQQYIDDQLELHQQFKKAIQKVHYTLLYQENTFRTKKNDSVKPSMTSYLTVLQMYSKLSHSFRESVQTGKMKWNFGLKSEQFLRLMMKQGYIGPNPVYYNLVICSYLNIDMDDTEHDGWHHRFIWARKSVRRDYRYVKAIEDAQRIFDEMVQYDQSYNEDFLYNYENEDELALLPVGNMMHPDATSYALLIISWASLENNRGAIKAQELLMNRPQNIKFGTQLYNVVLKAWCRSNDRDALRNALHIFEIMTTSYERATPLDSMVDNVVKPDRTTFNTVLHVLSKHGSRISLQKAEDILEQMELYEEKGYSEWAPNLFSYNTIIEGYSNKCQGHRFSANNSDLAMKAFHILRKILLAQKKQEQKNKIIEGSYINVLSPDTFSFNRVIFALAKSRIRQSALLIEEIIKYMERQYDGKGNWKVRPDLYSYSSAISAWARSNEQDAGARAEALLKRMQERYANGEKALKPNVVTFNAVIDCYAKSRQGTAGARKAEQLLEMMETMYNEGDKSVKPNVLTYNSMLSAWARSNTKCAHWKSLAILRKMWTLYKAGNESVKPDTTAYNTLISAISKSELDDKAQKALRLLREMDLLYRSGGEDNTNLRPNEISYTSVLNSCAYSTADDLNVRRKALDTAIFTFEELRDSPYGEPNHVTYSMYLQCCANLIPSDDEIRRITLIEPVFQQCCRDGQVNQVVLNQLRLAAPDDLFERLLGKVVQKKNGTLKRVTVEDLPAEWKCNVRNETWKGRRRKVHNRKYKSDR